MPAVGGTGQSVAAVATVQRNEQYDCMPPLKQALLWHSVSAAQVSPNALSVDVAPSAPASPPPSAVVLASPAPPSFMPPPVPVPVPGPVLVPPVVEPAVEPAVVEPELGVVSVP